MMGALFQKKQPSQREEGADDRKDFSKGLSLLLPN